MLEQDPSANLNREIPITPIKPKPKQDYQHLAKRMLPHLTITCFKIKQKDYQAIGEIGQLCFDQRARSDNGARERLARKILESFARTKTTTMVKKEDENIKSENNNGTMMMMMNMKSEPIG